MVPPIPGVDLPGVFTLRNLHDTDRIEADAGPRRAAGRDPGGGFIGLELAENLVRRGISTTIVERNGQVLPPLDRGNDHAGGRELRGQGVELLLGQSAEAFQ